MNSIKVSVIMAEYNTNSEDLHASIKSILDQTFKDFEFIIVDDGGSNNLQQIANDFNDERIKIVSNNGNKGFVYSLNNAINHAKSDYLVRMDTDDIVTQDRIQILYDTIQSMPEYDVISSRAVEFSGDQEFGVIGKKGEKTKCEVMRGDVPVHAAAIMKKSAVHEVGGYKEQYVRAEDLALWCDLLLAGKRLYMLDNVLYKYRVNRNDYKKRTLRHRKGEIAARFYYYPKLKAGPIEYLRIVKSIVAGLLPVGMIQAYRNRFVVKNSGDKI